MDVGFAGTPAFAAEVLAGLLDAGFRVPVVLTQPDRPQGRGQKFAPSPVKALAIARGLAVAQPATLKAEAACAAFFAIPVDVLAVAAYGLILPPRILAWPRHGCINVHASLLPRWRGAAPIQRALLAGDSETGVTIMRMDAGLDTGPMLEAVRVPIGLRETRQTLEQKLAVAGTRALVTVLRRLAAGGPIPAVLQPDDGATYAAKVDKWEAAIDWRAAAAVIDRQIRAFDPAPGAHTVLAGESLKVWRAQPLAWAGRDISPGAVVAVDAAGIVVACGDGALRVEDVQPAGGRRMPAAAFAAGRQLMPGARFGGATD